MIKKLLAFFGYELIPLRLHCLNGGYCIALAWKNCTSARCKYHCDLNCKCNRNGSINIIIQPKLKENV